MFIATPKKRSFGATGDKTRINEQINAPQVRVIDAEGHQLGVMSSRQALLQAQEVGLDLIEVSPTASPPVCRLMDYGKFKYQQSKRQHEAKKHQKVIQVKELKLRPKTEEHDFMVKVKSAIRFLEEGDKVKVSVMFRGREITHRELGYALMQKFEQAVVEKVVEQPIKDEGRTISMILAPVKTS